MSISRGQNLQCVKKNCVSAAKKYTDSQFKTMFDPSIDKSWYEVFQDKMIWSTSTTPRMHMRHEFSNQEIGCSVHF